MFLVWRLRVGGAKTAPPPFSLLTRRPGPTDELNETPATKLALPTAHTLHPPVLRSHPLTSREMRRMSKQVRQGPAILPPLSWCPADRCLWVAGMASLSCQHSGSNVGPRYRSIWPNPATSQSRTRLLQGSPMRLKDTKHQS